MQARIRQLPNETAVAFGFGVGKAAKIADGKGRWGIAIAIASLRAFGTGGTRATTGHSETALAEGRNTAAHNRLYQGASPRHRGRK